MREQVVIVGAGIVGMAIALRLRLKGWNVTVLDQAQPGGGASSAALGNITPYSDHDITSATKHLAEISLARYPEWLAEVQSLSGETIDYDAWGTLEIALEDEEAAHLTSTYAAMEEASPVEWLSSSDAVLLEPSLNPAVLGAIFYKTESTLDTTQLIAACAKAARKAGCAIASNTRVTRIIEAAGSVVGVETPLGAIRCDRVVLAPGADLAHIEGSPRLPLERIRG
jgi:glycine/D-amino acid oxidase-like deaminating enzyme